MALDTVSAKRKRRRRTGAVPLGKVGPRPTVLPEEDYEDGSARLKHRRRRRLFSTLTLRVLAPNLFALAILVGGVLYLDQYRNGLVDAKVAALQTQGEIIAGALGESAVLGTVESRRLDAEVARQIVRRLAVPAGTRARLFNTEGKLVADSRDLISAGRHVQLKYLPPPGEEDALTKLLIRIYDWVLPRLPGDDNLPPYRERPDQMASDYPEAMSALAGEIDGAVRSDTDGSLVITVAFPVQQFRQVMGALMLSADSSDIEERVRSVRLAIIEVFGLALAVSVLLSIFLAGTIAKPVRQLALAADRVRSFRGRRIGIPDFSKRRDEIGDLSVALRDMTDALYARLDAIEAFAADVAHEIKNPLTSIRSALETVARSKNPAEVGQLLRVMQEDVQRLDRLISDISNASRVDAELVRETLEPVDLVALLETVVEIYQSRANGDCPRLELRLPPAGRLVIEGVPGRLGQVVDNLVSNAVSFSPAGGVIRLHVGKVDGMAQIAVEDEGPGLPEANVERIFQRFYTQRPAGEAFGRHSGLGLSIARQIVEAHGGSIVAMNRKDPQGGILGARFVVRLPI